MNFSKAKVFLLLVGMMGLSACGGSGGAVNAQSPNNDPVKNPDQRNTPKDTPRNKGFYLIFTSRDLISSSLCILSTNAHDAVPPKITPYDLDYSDPVVFSSLNYAVAVAKEHFASGKYMLQLIKFSNKHTHTLFTSARVLSDPFPSRDEKWISFSEMTPDGPRVRLINLESKVTVDVPVPRDVPVADTRPIFSYEGSLLFERKTKDSSMIMAAMGSNGVIGEIKTLVQVSLPDTVGFISASPTSPSTFVYIKGSGKTSQLILRTHEAEKIISTSEPHEPSWSLDGNSVIFWSEDLNGQRIQSYDVKTGKVSTWARAALSDKGSEGHVCPTFSPDMTEIYFSANGNYWNQIYKVNVKDLSLTRLTDPNIPPGYLCPRVILSYGGKQ